MKKWIGLTGLILLMGAGLFAYNKDITKTETDQADLSQETYAQSLQLNEEEVDSWDSMVNNIKTGEVVRVSVDEMDSVPVDMPEASTGDGDLTKLEQECKDAEKTKQEEKKDRKIEDLASEEFFTNIIGKDNRKTVSSTKRVQYPYCAVVQLETTFPNGKKYQGSGYMVGRNTIVTAAHVIYHEEDRYGSENGFANSVKIYPGRNGDDCPYGVTYATYLTVPYGFINATTKDGKYTDGMRENDYGVIRVDNNLGDRIGWFGFMNYEGAQSKDQKFYQVGYYHKKMCSEKGKKIKKYEEPLLYTSFDHTRGQSGSPIYIKKKDGCYVIGHTIAGKKKHNIAMSMNRNSMEFIRKNKQ